MTDTLPTSQTRIKPRKSWGKRLVRLTIVVIVLAVIFRIGLNILFGTVVRQVASLYDLNIEFDRKEIALLGGDAGLYKLKVSPKSANEPMLTADYVRGNISTLALLRGKLDVWRLEADGVQINLQRAPDGTLPELDFALKQFASTSKAPSPNSTGKPIDLTAPFKVDAIRVQRLRVNWRDRAATPNIVTSLGLNLSVSDIRAPSSPTRFEGELWSDQLLDVMRFEGQGTSSGRKLSATMSVAGRGLNLAVFAPYLRAIGIEPTGRGLDWAGRLAVSTDAGPTPTALKATLALTDVNSRDAAEQPFLLDKLEIVADSIDTDGIHLSDLWIDGARVRANRDTRGSLEFAGLRLVSPVPTDAPLVLPQFPDSLSGQTSAVTSPGKAFTVTLDKFKLTNIELGLSDLLARANIGLRLDEFTSNALAKDARGQTTVPFEGVLSSPGLAGRINLKGSLQPFVAPFEVDATFDATGVRLDAIQPYLDLFGLDSTFNNGTASAKFSGQLMPGASGGLSLNLAATDITLNDGKDQLVLPKVAVDDFAVDPGGDLSVKSIAVQGPSVVIRHEGRGIVSTVGLKLDPHGAPRASNAISPDAPATQPATRATTRPTTAPAIPRIQLDSFEWTGADIRLEDLAQSPVKVLEVKQPKVIAKNLVLDLAAKHLPTAPGTIDAALSIPSLVESLTAQGQVIASQDGPTNRTRFTLATSGKKIDLTPLAGYLTPLNITPTLSDGTLDASLNLDLSQTDGMVSLSTQATGVSLKQAGELLGGVESVRIDGVSLASRRLGIKAIEVLAPSLRVERRANRHISALGLSVNPKDLAGTPGPPVAGEPLIPLPQLPIDLTVDTLSINQARLDWTDEAIEGQPVNIPIIADVTGAITNPEPGNTRARINAVIMMNDQFVERTQADLEANLLPDRLEIKTLAQLTGISGKGAAPYLPPGFAFNFTNGQLTTSAEATLLNTNQGQSLDASLGSTLLLDRNLPVLRLDAAQVVAPRIDLSGGVLQLSTLKASGVETAASFRHDGTIILPGLTITPVAAPIQKKDDAIVVEASPTASGSGQAELEAAKAMARAKLPHVTLDTLDLRLKRVSIRDDSRPESAPLALSDFSLTNASTIAVGGDDPDARPPFDLAIAGQVEPLVNNVDIKVRTQPFASESTATITFDFSDIQGGGLTQLVPELASMVDGSKLNEGRATGELDAKVRFQKRGPWIDVRRGFEGELALRNIAYRAKADGPVLAGVEGVSIDAFKINPNLLGGSAKAIEVTKPLFRAIRDKDGIQVLGWTIADPLRKRREVAFQTVSSDPVAASPANPPSATSDTPEWKVDRLLVTGLDALVRDVSVEPQLTVPLTNLDVEVRGLNSRALREPRPIRFSALVSSGKVMLPSRKTGSPEERDLLSQVTATGVMVMHPHLEGWAKASVSGFELASIQGLAKELTGINLSDGIFDGTFDLRFRDGGNLDLRSRLVLTDLNVQDSSEAFMQRLLKLPVPLQIGIDTVKDASGSITLPINVPVRAGEVSLPKVIASSFGAVGQVVGTAIASAPLKLLGGGKSEGPPPLPPIQLQFAPGDPGLSEQAQTQLMQLALAMKKDKNLTVQLSHTLGGGDIERAATRANPTTQQSVSMADELRTQRLVLATRRATVAGQARAAAINQGDAAVLIELRIIDQELARLDDALDRVLDLQRPGADRQFNRRTRAAAIDVANLRIDAVRRFLADAGVPNTATRVSFQNPGFAEATDDAGGVITLTSESKKRAR